MLRISRLTDYATVLMTALATKPGQLYSAQELSERSHLAATTVAKLLKQLARAGLVEATRGAQGGYRLKRAAEAITIADVVDAVEGPISVTSCAIHSGDCGIESSCDTRANWRLINTAIRQALEAVTLAHMATPRQVISERPLKFHPGSGPALRRTPA